jgi:hypothetical protein
MVALLKEDSIAQRSEPMPQLAPRLRLVPNDQSPLRLDLETPPHMADLVDLDGNLVRREDERQETHHSGEVKPAITPTFAVVTAILILALLSFVRISQGAPPASSWDSLAPTPAVASAPGVGETVRIIDAGDTLWAIAGEIAPDVDRRLAVDVLAQRNGGSGVQVGQRLVIPQELASS